MPLVFALAAAATLHASFGTKHTIELIKLGWTPVLVGTMPMYPGKAHNTEQFTRAILLANQGCGSFVGNSDGAFNMYLQKDHSVRLCLWGIDADRVLAFKALKKWHSKSFPDVALVQAFDDVDDIAAWTDA